MRLPTATPAWRRLFSTSLRVLVASSAVGAFAAAPSWGHSGPPAHAGDAAGGPAAQDAGPSGPYLGRVQYRERSSPPAGTPVRGAVLLLHRGGWHSSPAAVKGLRPTAKRLNGYGFVVHNIDYADHAAGLRDALASFDRMRAAHPRLPLCTYGESAGGHLALLVAVLRHVDCVVSDAGPVRLNSFRPWTPAVEGGTWRLIREAFGTDPAVLDAWSPASYAERLRQSGTRLLIAYSDFDLIVPAEQATHMRRVPGARLYDVEVVASPTDLSRHVTWVHTRVSVASLALYHLAQRRFLLTVAGARAVG